MVVVMVLCPELAERVLMATRWCTRTCSSTAVQEPWRCYALGVTHDPCAVVDRVSAVEDVSVGVVGHRWE